MTAQGTAQKFRSRLLGSGYLGGASSIHLPNKCQDSRSMPCELLRRRTSRRVACRLFRKAGGRTASAAIVRAWPNVSQACRICEPCHVCFLRSLLCTYTSRSFLSSPSFSPFGTTFPSACDSQPPPSERSASSHAWRLPLRLMSSSRNELDTPMDGLSLLSVPRLILGSS